MNADQIKATARGAAALCIGPIVPSSWGQCQIDAESERFTRCIINAIRTALDEARQVCSICAGTGTNLDGSECACKDNGAAGEVIALRDEMAHLQAQVIMARGALQRLGPMPTLHEGDRVSIQLKREDYEFIQAARK